MVVVALPVQVGQQGQQDLQQGWPLYMQLLPQIDQT